MGLYTEFAVFAIVERWRCSTGGPPGEMARLIWRYYVSRNLGLFLELKEDGD